MNIIIVGVTIICLITHNYPLYFKQMQIGKAIIYLRKLKGYSQETLAIESDISRHYMYKLENDKASPTISMLEKICKTLNMKPSELIKTAEEIK